MTSITNTDRLRIRWQRKFITGASVAEDVPTVSAVMLPPGDGELLFTLLAVSRFVILQPGMALQRFIYFFDIFHLQL